MPAGFHLILPSLTYYDPTYSVLCVPLTLCRYSGLKVVMSYLSHLMLFTYFSCDLSSLKRLPSYTTYLDKARMNSC
jgi:hypothetical protein